MGAQHSDYAPGIRRAISPGADLHSLPADQHEDGQVTCLLHSPAATHTWVAAGLFVPSGGASFCSGDACVAGGAPTGRHLRDACVATTRKLIIAYPVAGVW